jgi:beta-galactosidase/beta-glucuronidase
MSRTVLTPQEKQVATIEGPWNISFQEKHGAPANATFETLTPWNENKDPGIKYFSGTGTYTRTIYAQAEWFKEGTELWINLGSVKNLAEVIINGMSLGIVWKTPFMVNVTKALKQGENNIEIKVTNLWVNRLIGDQQPNVGKKITYTTMPFYKPDSPLKVSGLLGPVQIVCLGN